MVSFYVLDVLPQRKQHLLPIK